MSRRAALSGPTAREMLTTLRQRLPELESERRWPSSIAIETFADHVSDRARAGATREELETYFAFVEELAASGDPDAENLVIVDFLEAADWDADLIGPTTLRLAGEADLAPGRGRDSATVMGPGAIHAELVDRFPVLGELCFNETFTEASQLGWEAYVGGRPDVAGNAMCFAEWLLEQGRADLAEHAVSPLFDPSTAADAGAGPRVLEMLRHH